MNYSGVDAKMFFDRIFASFKNLTPTVKTKTDDGITTMEEFHNHYNVKRNKCVILISSQLSKIEGKRDHVFQTSVSLWDVNENKNIGHFIEDEKYEGDCEAVGIICHSKQEWENLIKPYMEE
jgi:hypothetical protein